jgi:hypothetical protein
MARTFRSVFYHLVPSWLYTGDGGKILHALMMMLDAWVERVRLGFVARMPTRADPVALALIGQDRGLLRGRTESAENYAQRLIGWRYPRGHRVRGSAFALLSQVASYWGEILCWTIDVSGNYHEHTAAGVESYTYGNAWDWDGLGSSPAWGRFWLGLELPIDGVSEQLDYGDPDLWGGQIGLEGYTIGQQGVTPADVEAMRRLMRPPAWKPAGVRAEWVIVNIEGSGFAGVVPDGTWLHWSQNVAGTQTPTRDPAFRYWSLDPTRNNAYAGDPDNFPELLTVAGGTTYGGDPDEYPAVIDFPNGDEYAGNPDNFPATIQLIDDGSPTS